MKLFADRHVGLQWLFAARKLFFCIYWCVFVDRHVGFEVCLVLLLTGTWVSRVFAHLFSQVRGFSTDCCVFVDRCVGFQCFGVLLLTGMWVFCVCAFLLVGM